MAIKYNMTPNKNVLLHTCGVQEIQKVRGRLNYCIRGQQKWRYEYEAALKVEYYPKADFLGILIFRLMT